MNKNKKIIILVAVAASLTGIGYALDKFISKNTTKDTAQAIQIENTKEQDKNTKDEDASDNKNIETTSDSKNNTKDTKTASTSVNTNSKASNSDWIYSIIDNYLYRLKPDGSEKTKIEKNPIHTNLQEGKYIYYVAQSADANGIELSPLYRYEPVTNIKTKITDIDTTSFCIVNGLIYFDKDFKVYSINPDTKQIIQISKENETDTIVSKQKASNLIEYRYMDSKTNKVMYKTIQFDTNGTILKTEVIPEK